MAAAEDVWRTADSASLHVLQYCREKYFRKKTRKIPSLFLLGQEIRGLSHGPLKVEIRESVANLVFC